MNCININTALFGNICRISVLINSLAASRDCLMDYIDILKFGNSWPRELTAAATTIAAFELLMSSARSRVAANTLVIIFLLIVKSFLGRFGDGGLYSESTSVACSDSLVSSRLLLLIS